jgi:hypothetical protein
MNILVNLKLHGLFWCESLTGIGRIGKLR